MLWVNGVFREAAGEVTGIESLPLPGGPGAFETMRLARGRVALLEQHCARLARAAAQLGGAGDLPDWPAILAELVARSGRREGSARIAIGCGVQAAGLGPLPQGLRREQEEGIALRSSAARVEPPAVFKSLSRPALREAECAAGGEVLLRGPAGELLETSRANLFWVRGDTLWTAPQTAVLPGIARALVLELLEDCGLAAIHQALAPPLPANAEAFLTNALRGVRPLVALDGRPLPPPGPLTRRLQAELDRRMGCAA
jgi:branched-chain amino acid aminotransferase